MKLNVFFSFLQYTIASKQISSFSSSKYFIFIIHFLAQHSYTLLMVMNYNLTDIPTSRNRCSYMFSTVVSSTATGVTTLQNRCSYMNEIQSLMPTADVTTLQNRCSYMRNKRFMLLSCFNLAGCNPVLYETGKQSRQVRRRKFGIIHPYLIY